MTKHSLKSGLLFNDRGIIKSSSVRVFSIGRLQRGCHLCQKHQKCQKYHPFYHLFHDFFTLAPLALALAPIGAGSDHVIKGAYHQTLAAGDGERVGVGG